MNSDPITSSLGKITQYTHPEGKDKKFKMNYAVPNFGVDHEIVENANSLAISEKALNHKLVIPKSTRAKDLGVPPVHKAPFSDKLDSDVVTTLKNDSHDNLFKKRRRITRRS